MLIRFKSLSWKQLSIFTQLHGGLDSSVMLTLPASEILFWKYGSYSYVKMLIIWVTHKYMYAAGILWEKRDIYTNPPQLCLCNYINRWTVAENLFVLFQSLLFCGFLCTAKCLLLFIIWETRNI